MKVTVVQCRNCEAKTLIPVSKPGTFGCSCGTSINVWRSKTDDGGIQEKKIAVLGTPCGATTLITRALQQKGLQVRHENMGKDGTVCGFAWWGYEWHGNVIDTCRFEFKVQLVRHPLLCCKSLYKYTEGADPAKADHYDDVNQWPFTHTDPLLRGLRYWVATHEGIESWADYLLRADGQLNGDWAKLMSKMALPHKMPNVEGNVGKKGHYLEPPTWAQWYDKDPDWANRGAQLVERLGLEEPE